MSVVLSPHDPDWAESFAAEKSSVVHALEPAFVALQHIGSTSIPGILAKPIIDMLGEVEDFDLLDRSSAVLEGLGYEVMGAYGIDGRRYFRKTDANGRRSHHLHVFETAVHHIWSGTWLSATTFEHTRTSQQSARM